MRGGHKTLTWEGHDAAITASYPVHWALRQIKLNKKNIKYQTQNITNNNTSTNFCTFQFEPFSF